MIQLHRLIIPIIILLTSCSHGQKMTTTQAQAIALAEELIHDTAAALRPTPRLELLPYSAAPNPCAFADDGLPERITVSRAYWLRDVPRVKPVTLAQQVQAHWQQQGHVIVSTGGFEVGHPSIGGKSTPDGYTLALVWAEGDNLYLAATSPCIWPNGTPNR